VTAVDPSGRLLPEAGRARHVDFAAPGSDLAVAKLGGGWAVARGTSFSAPFVSALLAREMTTSVSRDQAMARLAAHALRHGGPYGRGLVAMELRTPPGAVGARAALVER
jgi:hypothetical protein